MKNLILIFLCFTSLLPLNAQELSSNKYILGGAFNYTYQMDNNPLSALGVGISPLILFPLWGRIEKSSSHQFLFSPFFAKEVTQNWTVGLHLRFQFGNGKIETSTDFNTTQVIKSLTRQYSAGIFARYHFNSSQRLNIFLQPFFTYNSINGDQLLDEIPFNENSITYFDVGITPGLRYKFSDKFQATLNFGGLSFLDGKSEVISKIKSIPDSSKSFSTFNANFNLTSLLIGVEFRL